MFVEILLSADLIERGRLMLEAMAASAPEGVELEITKHYRGVAPVLMVYGLGHPVRRAQWQGHLAKGGRVIGWDLGYWHRKIPGNPSMRLSIDADHPQAMIRDEPGERWLNAGIELRDDFNPSGPIVLCGMGWKSKRILSDSQRHWEADTLRRIRRVAGAREVIYRPKRDSDPSPHGMRIVRGSIETVIRGASLVVCRHSNVAVDACIAGIPVVCEDGAAAALYGNDLQTPRNPTFESRRKFLESLAWWQYHPSEAGIAWQYLKQRGVL